MDNDCDLDAQLFFEPLDTDDDDKLLATFLPYPNPDCPADKDPSYDGPMPIINATLNLVHGDNLAWQQRKGASFFWTPLYSGFEIPET